MKKQKRRDRLVMIVSLLLIGANTISLSKNDYETTAQVNVRDRKSNYRARKR